MDSSRGVLGMVLLMAVLCPSVLGQRCVFMGSCLFDKNIDKSVPCAVDQEPMEKLPDAQWTEFAEFCNDLAVTLPVGDRRLCCDSDQFRTLKKEMASAEAIGMKRCPGCYTAFRNLMCQMTCSPRQADFIVVNATRAGAEPTWPALQEVVYGLDQNFAETLYGTCNGARSNLLVKLTTLMCGRWGNRCSTKRFLRFLGSTDSEGGYSPFKIRHILLNETNDGMKIMDYLGREKVLRRFPLKTYSSCDASHRT